MTDYQKKKAGTTLHLVLAIVLTLLTISTAVLLNNLHKSMSVPTSALLKADYQMESAIVMQMQKIRNDTKNSQKDGFAKEISPGYLLTLSSEQISPEVWTFKVSVDGPSFSRHIQANASLENPDRIVYLK